MGTGGTLTVWSPANLSRNPEALAKGSRSHALELWSGAWQEGYPTASISFRLVLPKQRTAYWRHTQPDISQRNRLVLRNFITWPVESL